MPTLKSVTSIAVFDVDGTLLKDNIGVTFVKYLLANGLVRTGPKLLIYFIFTLYKLKILDFGSAIKAGAWAMAGLSVEDVKRHAEACYVRDIQPYVYGDARREIDKCRAEGMGIAIATGAHSAIAEALARDIGADVCIATQSETKSAKYGYKIAEPLPYKEGKRDAVLHELKSQFVPAPIIVYTDEKKDLPLLSAASKMIAVNPDKETRDYVTSHGGTVVSFR